MGREEESKEDGVNEEMIDAITIEVDADLAKSTSVVLKGLARVIGPMMHEFNDHFADDENEVEAAAQEAARALIIGAVACEILAKRMEAAKHD